MQGQRSTVQFFPEAFDFEHASSSRSSGIDHQVYWNNMLNPGDTQSMPDCLLPRIEANMSYRNAFTESIGGWNLGGPSSSEPIIHQGSHVGAGMENVWTSSSTTNSVAGPRFEERRLEAANMLSLDGMVMDLNSHQIAHGQCFLRNSSSADSPHNVYCNAGITGSGSQVPQTGICSFYIPFASEVEQIASGSSNPCEISTGDDVGLLPEDADGRPGNLLDGRRIAGKRKNIEGVPGPSSGSSSNSSFHQAENNLLHTVPARNISSASSNIHFDDLSSVHPPEEHLNPGFIGGARGPVSECLSSIDVARSVESSQRNFRLRINPAHQLDSSIPNLYPLESSSMNHSGWFPHQSSHLLIPVNQPLETRPAIPRTRSQSQSHLPTIPGLPQMVHPFPWNGTSRIGCFSNSHTISSNQLAALREEANLRGLERNSILEHPMFFPATEVRRLAQNPANWGLANGNMSIPRNVASTSQVGSTSGVHPSIAPTWTPHQNSPRQHQPASSEIVYRSFPAAMPDPSAQLNNFLLQHSEHSSSSEIAPQRGVGVRTSQQSLLRSAFLMGGRSNVLSAPSTLRSLAAAREGRNMMMLEHIRNALHHMRRSESMRFEDVLILDESELFGSSDLHDRHRDMRLDIDNLSYEELLALEERIGNVSTGLSEETVVKHLKQRTYLSLSLTSPIQSEPCCICQEEYIDGDDIGRLDCGHDFHTACIKQWLTLKNVCPICKLTALATS